jgi:hypothetical protein
MRTEKVYEKPKAMEFQTKESMYTEEQRFFFQINRLREQYYMIGVRKNRSIDRDLLFAIAFCVFKLSTPSRFYEPLQTKCYCSQQKKSLFFFQVR